jgi:hypothetical protein
MARKLHPLVKLDKDLAEGLFGHSPGRPTLSRRAGRLIDRATGIGEDAGTDAFHLGLVAGAIAWVVNAAKKP